MLKSDIMVGFFFHACEYCTFVCELLILNGLDGHFELKIQFNFCLLTYIHVFKWVFGAVASFVFSLNLFTGIFFSGGFNHLRNLFISYFCTDFLRIGNTSPTKMILYF